MKLENKKEEQHNFVIKCKQERMGTNTLGEKIQLIFQSESEEEDDE